MLHARNTHTILLETKRNHQFTRSNIGRGWERGELFEKANSSRIRYVGVGAGAAFVKVGCSEIGGGREGTRR